MQNKMGNTTFVLYCFFVLASYRSALSDSYLSHAQMQEAVQLVKISGLGMWIMLQEFFVILYNQSFFFFPSCPYFPPEIMLLWNMAGFLKLACANDFLFNRVLQNLKYADTELDIWLSE